MTEELVAHQFCQSENERLTQRCAVLEEKMIDWYRSMNGNLSLEDARDHMEQELALYFEVFGG
nr:hypothetical protein [Edwardsiella ictaluri]